ncbi:outer membrane protein [Methylovirgula ligni]|uniref:outer membrane protein n=2 Tax=Methylovirgula ligni TaxID=569860 RepID=UPI001FDF93E1|nr:outer membrane beta-barrel protein [Methylovirgula ligni]
MIRTLLLSSAICVVAAGAAFAADLPSTKGEPVYAPPPAPIFSWTGFYIGVNGGYGGNNVNYNEYDPYGEGYSYHEKLTSSGFVAGGTVGFNYQFPTSNFVLGFEGDFDWSDIKGEDSYTDNYADYSYGETYGSKLNWLATARARIGYAVSTPFGNLLPYVTGGAAFGNVKDYDYGGYSYGDDYSDSWTHTWTGWTAGAGLEYAITQNLSFKAEYLYVDLGNHGVNDEYTDLDPGIQYSEHFTANIVRLGLNWRFGDWFAPPPPPPVVAKY